MPRNSPFTALCGQLAKLNRPRRADLHIHTNASDGEYTPSQVVALARQAGLSAAAITDHDTLAAVREAQEEGGEEFEIVPGVEISAEFAGREVHLLGYFIRLDHPELNARLAEVCVSRRERFRDFIAELAHRGNELSADRVKLVEDVSPSLGRRHVAALLTVSGTAQNNAEAFQRFLGPLTGLVRPKSLIPVEEAIHLVRTAFGVPSLAHPPANLSDHDFFTLAGFGLAALEVNYPWGRNSRAGKLLEATNRFGFACTGGSDCHGPHPPHRRIGSHGIASHELDRLRKLCGSGNGVK
jgi:3',5'-nucleoside bisphosphate phosphatase